MTEPADSPAPPLPSSPRRDLRVGDEGVEPYPLLTSIVVPRPIAWVSTLDRDGVGNLAPHSFFSVASGQPPVIMFSSLGRKDTLRNIEATGEFVVCLTPDHLLDAVNDSSAPFDASTDESERLSIPMEPSTTVAPPRVADSPAAMECTLHSITRIGNGSVVYGQVRLFSIADSAFEGDSVLPAMKHLRPLSRLGGDEWGRPPEVFSIPRPASPDDVRR